jgi:hypothetical protein
MDINRTVFEDIVRLANKDIEVAWRIVESWQIRLETDSIAKGRALGRCATFEYLMRMAQSPEEQRELLRHQLILTPTRERGDWGAIAGFTELPDYNATVQAEPIGKRPDQPPPSCQG